MGVFCVRLVKNKHEALNKRVKILLHYWLGPLLFVGLGFSIYYHILQQPDFKQSLNRAWQSLRGGAAHSMLAVVGLMLVNWSCEALKWRTLIQHIQPVSFLKAFRAILSGLTFSVALSTPNGIGEYFGRVLYLDDGNRLRAISLTFVGSLSQLLVTLIMGTAGLIVLKPLLLHEFAQHKELSLLLLNASIGGLLAGSIGLIVMYFKLSWLVTMLERLPFIKRWAFFIQKIEELDWRELLQVLLFSALRYIVFVVQYLVLLQVFGVDVGIWSGIWLTALMFLALAVVPTIALAELGIRGQLGIFLFGLLSTNTVGILLTASCIWLINIVLPAVAGSLFYLGLKFFRNR